MSSRRILPIVACLLLLGSTLAQAQVALTPKQPENSTRTYDTTQLVKQTLTIMGMPIETDVDAATTTTFKSGKRDAGGNLEVQVTNDSIRQNLTLTGGASLNFDSAVNISKTTLPQLQFVLDALKTLAGSTYTLVYDDEQAVVSVKGGLDIVNRAPASAVDFVKILVDEGRLKKEQATELERFPTDPVKQGDTWMRTVPVDLGSGQTLTVEREFKYAGPVVQGGKSLDKIEITDVKVVSLDLGQNLPLQLVKQDLKIEGSKGSILFDREKGFSVSEEHVLTLKGTLTLSAMGQELPSELDLKIETKSQLRP